MWLRLNEADEGHKQDVISEWKGNVKQFLQSTLVSRIWSAIVLTDGDHDMHQTGPQGFVLRHDEHDERLSTVVIESRYIPVPVQLEPRETVNSKLPWSM